MSKKNPLVSIVVPCYNHEKYVEETIESIINQTYKNIELIVIDDGSKDNSPYLLESMSKKYGFYYEHQKNIGLSATLNKAIKMSKGKYISLTASDDFFELDKIEVLVDEFEKLDDEYAVVCGDARFIDENGKKILRKNNNKLFSSFIKYYTDGFKDVSMKNFGIYHSFIDKNYIPAMSTLLRKSAILEVGLYNTNFCLEDWDIWLKLSKKYKFHYIDRVVASYRIHNENSSLTMKGRLFEDMFFMIKYEKEFCYLNGFNDKWDLMYYDLLFSLLNTFKFKLFINNCNMLDLLKMIHVFFRLKISKIIKKFTRLN